MAWTAALWDSWPPPAGHLGMSSQRPQVSAKRPPRPALRDFRPRLCLSTSRVRYGLTGREQETTEGLGGHGGQPLRRSFNASHPNQRWRNSACHWRSRLCFLLPHGLGMGEYEPRGLCVGEERPRISKARSALRTSNVLQLVRPNYGSGIVTGVPASLGGLPTAQPFRLYR